MVTSSYLNFYCKKEKKFLPGEIKVKVLPPFQTRGMSIDQVGQLTKHLQDTMQKEFDLLNKEINLDEKYYTKNIGSNDSTKTTNNGNASENINKSIGSLNNLSSNSLINDDLLSGESLNNTTNKSIVNDDNNNSIHEEETKKML